MDYMYFACEKDMNFAGSGMESLSGIIYITKAVRFMIKCFLRI